MTSGPQEYAKRHSCCPAALPKAGRAINSGIIGCLPMLVFCACVGSVRERDTVGFGRCWVLVDGMWVLETREKGELCTSLYNWGSGSMPGIFLAPFDTELGFLCGPFPVEDLGNAPFHKFFCSLPVFFFTFLCNLDVAYLNCHPFLPVFNHIYPFSIPLFSPLWGTREGRGNVAILIYPHHGDSEKAGVM